MEEKTITVSGHGTLNIVPDVTRIDLTLKSLHETYAEAYSQAKEDADKLSAIMKKAKLDPTLPKTTSLEIEKQTRRDYDRNDNYRGDILIGFLLVHKVEIDLGMDKVLLNKVLHLIGQELKQAEIVIGHTVRDPRPAQLQMLERAVKDAKEKATIMATASGCQLGDVKSIDYSVHALHVYSQYQSIPCAEDVCCIGSNPDAALDITPNDIEQSERVNISWYLKQGAGEA